MKRMRMTLITFLSYTFLVIAAVLDFLHMVQSANFIFGGEAKRVCDAYKLICPAKKVCALQSIEWPRIMKFPVCVHETHLVVKSKICRQPPDPGKCKAQFMRWYFNVHMGTCSWFTYSGCGGNQNNFRMSEECESRCMRDENGNFDKRKASIADRRQDGIDGVAIIEQILDIKGNNPEDNRELKLITAPAPAAEIIDLDTDVTASLQLNSKVKNSTTNGKEEKRNKKKEKEKKKRRKNKKKNHKSKRQRKDDDKLLTSQPTRQFTEVELGPNFGDRIFPSNNDDKSPKFAELKGRQTTVSKFRNSNNNDRLTWRMDKQFRRWIKHEKKLQDHERPRTDVSGASSGAKQDTYYDKVKLFDILKNQEDAKQNQM